MVRINKISKLLGFSFPAIVLIIGLGCAFIQEQIGIISSQKTKAITTVPMVLTDTAISSVQTTQSLTNTLTSQLASTEIHNLSELNSIISSLDWTPSGGYTSLQVPISGDLQVAEAFSLAAGDLQAPPTCTERTDCRHTVAIELTTQLQGFSCKQTEQVLWREFCADVSIPTGARFRMRGILYDTHPGQWNYIPILQILPASDVPCLEGEFRCAVDNTCFVGFDDYCRTCQGLEKERCACQSPEGNLPNGSDCQYWQSGDVLMAGKCRAGVCK